MSNDITKPESANRNYAQFISAYETVVHNTVLHDNIQGCRGNWISIVIPIPYPQKICGNF